MRRCAGSPASRRQRMRRSCSRLPGSSPRPSSSGAVRAYRRVTTGEARELQEGAVPERVWEADGSLAIHGRLAPEDGALFLRALDAMRDALGSRAAVPRNRGPRGRRRTPRRSSPSRMPPSAIPARAARAASATRSSSTLARGPLPRRRGRLRARRRDRPRSGEGAPTRLRLAVMSAWYARGAGRSFAQAGRLAVVLAALPSWSPSATRRSAFAA